LPRAQPLEIRHLGESGNDGGTTASVRVYRLRNEEEALQLTLLKTKLHRGAITAADLDYEGSCAIDAALLERAGILEHEQIALYNVTNGARLTTYAIAAPAGSREICANGAAAHHMRAGDRVIICSYAAMPAGEAAHFTPRVLILDEHNRVTSERGAIARVA
jgi:aspartate 1-decarboxylase